MEDPKMTTHMRAFTTETDDPKVEAIMANMSRICAVTAAFDIRKHIVDLMNNKQALLSGAMGFSVTPEIFEHICLFYAFFQSMIEEKENAMAPAQTSIS